ncbi:MAG: phage tail tube protein [Pedobacter sp.]|uniref:phage tail tube protein n=1 Tax=Pedobacter sp. TaxID=1411316 RepID=UPI003567B0EE
MLESRALILAKIEATYGTDSAPVIATDAILTSKPTVEIIEETKAREVVLPYMGKLKDIPLGVGVKISFSVEVRGSGTAATPPRIGAILRACGFTQTLVVGPPAYVTYDPNSAQDIESNTVYFYLDGLLWKALGCVGNSCKLTMKTNEIAKFDFELTGLWGGVASITEVAFPSPTFGDSITPPILRSATFTIDTYAAIIESIETNLANTIIKRASANTSTGILRYSRIAREISGSCDPEVVALATYNPLTTWEAGTTGAIAVTVGNTTGNRLIVAIPNAMKKAPKFGAREGIVTYAIEFSANPTMVAGNTEVQFKFD